MNDEETSGALGHSRVKINRDHYDASPSSMAVLKRHWRIALVAAAWSIIIFGIAVAALDKAHTQDEQNIAVTVSLQPNADLLSFRAGSPVTVAADGTMRRGAGTSLYRNAGTFDSTDEVTHVVTANLDTTTIVVAYCGASGCVAQVGLVPAATVTRVETETSVIWSPAVSLAGMAAVDDVIVLSATTFTVAGRGVVYVATVTANHRDIYANVADTISQLSASVNVCPSPCQTIDNQIAGLSATRLIISYYDSLNGNNLFIRTIDVAITPSAVTLTMNTPLQYQSGRTASSIDALDSNTVIVSYLTEDQMVWPPVGGPLGATPIIVDTVTGACTAGLNTTLPVVAAYFFFDSAALDNSTVAVVFVDRSVNDGLRGCLMTVEIDSTTSLPFVKFGSLVTINDGGFQDSSVWTFITVSTLAVDRFMVVYSDLSNQGRVTMSICTKNDGAQIIADSPEFVLSPPNPKFDSDVYWVTATDLSSNRFVIIDSISDGRHDLPLGGHVTLGETLSTPIGLTAGSFASGTTGVSSLDVIVSGTVKVPMTLNPGRWYYATTLGTLVEGTHTSTDINRNPTEYVVNGDTIVTLDARVGLAVDSSHILIHI
ncbi:hypothetical protein CAOG_04254 [Capsaspora owczarzaki ATCC 30864]|uniref:Uncharacterized protein n=1 Tax=Capsaspora owczarzaki (strain ATCC 30864) TaxID=595528 RepID=A0A0D2UEB1_CAPO3|nr:hypothetical protein CAOG_04254 [Capsaspora owczarzaki ATCC 30864]KJE93466.1 hypothetical protein CAOG_004254 [Capsaspora owczarzaki ATCC 30864]|eukprot:XP_004348079.1 hypothetical protein CAOG_04254 [Capsaspora owczarzaki ATCC 30864]